MRFFPQDPPSIPEKAEKAPFEATGLCKKAALQTTFYVVHSVSDCDDFFRLFIGNFHVEFVFKFHDEFDDVERVSAQVVLKRRLERHLRFVNPRAGQR